MRNVFHKLGYFRVFQHSVALFGQVMEPLGGACLLEEVHFGGKVGSSLSHLQTAFYLVHGEDMLSQLPAPAACSHLLNIREPYA